MARELTEAERDLLDVAEWAPSAGEDARKALIEPAVNQVLGEALRNGYQFTYDACDGVLLHTPSGLLVWFCPECGCGGGIDVLVIAGPPENT